MAVDQVTSRTVSSVVATSGATTEAGLREGLTFDGRVLGVNTDNTIRLGTRYGTMDLSADVLLSDGGQTLAQAAAAEDLSTLIGMTLKLTVGAKDPAVAGLALKVVGVESQTPTAALGNTLTAAAAERMIDPQPVILSEVATAAARQDGLAPVYALASQLSASGETLPPAVSTAIAQLTGLTLPGDAAVAPAAVKSALTASGLFFEAKLANGTAPANGLAAGDLKAALFGLKAALDTWIGRQPATAASPAAAAAPAAASQAADPAVQQPGSPATPTPGQPRPSAVPLDTEALMAVLRPPPGSTTAQTPASTTLGQTPLPATNAPSASTPGAPTPGIPLPGPALPPGMVGMRPDLAAMAVLGELLQAAQPDGQRPQTRPAKGAPQVSATRDVDAGSADRPPPPKRGQPLKGQPAQTSPAGDGGPSIDIAKALSRKTGDAIARLTLGQYASLPESDSAEARLSPQHQAGSAWLFEVPIALKTGVGVAQFEIDRDAPEKTASPAEGPVWKVKFAVDVPPLGPVHGRLVLGGSHLAVAIWAEKPTAAFALSQETGQLRQALEQAGLSVDEIRFAAGPPPSGPPPRAGGFIDRKA